MKSSRDAMITHYLTMGHFSNSSAVFGVHSVAVICFYIENVLNETLSNPTSSPKVTAQSPQMGSDLQGQAQTHTVRCVAEHEEKYTKTIEKRYED